MKLQNKIVIITGAGSGMGREMARRFVQEGAKVVAADIHATGVHELARQLQTDEKTLLFCQVDVSDRQQVEAMIDRAYTTFGKLDVLVNNAGIMDGMMPITEVTDELWEKVLKVDLFGVMYACRYGVKRMLETGGGVIINTASVAGIQGARAGAAYTAAKHGVVGLTKNIGFMYANNGIRCNAICPGSVETNIGLGLKNASDFGLKRAMSGIDANPRNGKAEEVAEVALFLASDEASFVNGTIVPVDGGLIAY